MSLSQDIRYQDICIEKFAINVAYNNFPPWFELENGAMVDLRKKYQYYNLDDKVKDRIRGPISEFDEILSIFFKNYNIIVNWINCNGSFGAIDNLTGKWTGAVGQVNIYSMFIFVFKEFNP